MRLLWLRRWGSVPRSQWIALAALCLVAVAAMVTTVWDGDVEYPFGMLVPLLLAVVFLDNRIMSWFIGVEIALVATIAVGWGQNAIEVACLVLVVLLCLLVLALVLRDRPIGVTARRGESMLVDLRDRILAQGQIPELPDRWLVESSLSSAGGSPFAGDFVVATTRERGRRLEMALVDVSGKGEAAGTRALQLSGAMGGLLGALPPDQFLSAANEYLLARRWAEGFATAVHLSLDLLTGDYEIRAAGHPPPVQRHAGSGRWELLPTEGMILGLVEGVQYDGVRGRLARGDALLLYTDGMVEEPRKDIDLGIDAMLGTTESLLRGSWDGMARRLTAAVGSRDDDRALMLVHRR
ncbi:hypothetical protein HNR19_003185 [Nocardioides thalensis]|uniref:PPM-type phosphatase domain-containing protein n=1 Tax=Nocardioides thalensis TaxID=1914755 RepID=A0A853C5E9_9ACTN|nr:PP2C family protein-serine/threonine phosphatase [Nocardioides thalensis]NYJ02487.1 hypothetical protein [Nocardioides thalensis]